jgi:hypothetical protein
MDDKAARALTGSMADVAGGADPAAAARVVARLAELLGTSKLTDRQRREVAFVAGIRLSMPATGAAPE